MSHDGGSSCKSYIKHPTEKERLDNLAFTSFPEDYLPYTSSYHRKAPYLVWDDGFRPHRKRRLKRWRESRACRCCSAAALTGAISLIIIGILSIVAVSIYLGVITNLFRSPILSLSGKMSIVEGDDFTDYLLNTTSYEFLAKAETYEAMLENFYLSSSLEPAFVAAKVYAFRKGNLTVFFRIYLDRRKLQHSNEETLLVARNVVLEHAVKQRSEFSALSLDLSSIEFRENSDEEQTPEMDFNFHAEYKAKENLHNDEINNPQNVSHLVDSESKTENSTDLQQLAFAEADVSPKPFRLVLKENPKTTPYNIWRNSSSSESVSTPSHVFQHEKPVLSEHSVKDENVSVIYGQWQPLVPLQNSTLEHISTKRPSQKDHRRVSGSGSVHLIEDFIPVMPETPAAHNTPMPVANVLKPHPNVASTIMSSVSLVIRPSSKNRTVMISNNKNVIETAIKLPTQQAEDSKVYESLQIDSAYGHQTGNVSVLSTHNNHSSLQFIEHLDRNLNLHGNIDNKKTYLGLTGSSRTGIHSISHHELPRIVKKSSKLISEGSETVESKLLSEILAENLSELSSVGHASKIVSPALKERADTIEADTFSTEFSLFPENVSSGDVANIYSVAGKSEVKILSATPFAPSQNFVPNMNPPQPSHIPLSFVSESSSLSEMEISFTSMPTTDVGTTNLGYTSSKMEKRFESKIEYGDTVNSSTDVFLQNFKSYVTNNDSDSSGFLDADSLVPVDENDNPKIDVTVPSDSSHTVIKMPSSNFTEFPKRNFSLRNITFANDLHFPPFIGSHPQTIEASSDLPRNNSTNGTSSPDESGKYDAYSAATNADSIREVERNIKVHVNFSKQHTIEVNMSVVETALNGSNILDSKAGGLPKVVPPFRNTQFVPNDIHSDAETHQDDNHLDDAKLFPVTFGDVEFPEVKPSDKPQTVINKDSLDDDSSQPADEENAVIHHITTPLTNPENDSVVVGLGKYPTYFLNKCLPDEVACRSGECIPADYQCNMRRDCRDNSDEDHCSCSDSLKVLGQTQKICDGIQDCWDLSDEESCSWCTPGQFICPQSKLCIEMNQVCDGSNDCPLGTDEKYCVKLADDEVIANSAEYQPAGYLMIRKQGQWGKLCLENLHNITQPDNLKVKLGELGHAVCSALSYKEITEAIETKDETKKKQSYFEISTDSTKKQSRQYIDIFQASSCQSKSVVHVTCRSLECGMRPLAFSLRRRIVGGHSTSSGSWPWQVALYKEGDFQCGAVLVSDVWLISAGHCFYSSQKSHWTARLGVLRRGTELPSPSEQVRRITHTFIHPDYVDKGFINDIALLRMESPVPFSDFLRPLCLPNEIEEVNMWHGHHCSVVGWGKLYEIGHTFPDSLQEVRLPVISTEECRKKILFLTMYHLTENMFCAGYERGGRDACLGDSGGPLMCQRQDGRWVLLGVTSNGDGCGRPGRPGVYTKVTKYLTWIKQVIEGDLPPERSSTCEGHRCTLGHCVVESKVCDGHWDCSNGSDESNCFT